MKILPAGMLVLLSLCLVGRVQAKNTLPINPNVSEYTIGSIFFEDDENDVLFVDFQQIEEQLVRIKVLRRKKIIFSDNVKAVPQNAIYELELTDYKGKLTIELTTQSGLVIQKFIKK